MLDNYMFSLCLTPEGGIINIGDYNASLHAAPLQSVRFSSSKFYQVAMSGVQVTGGRAISPYVQRRKAQGGGCAVLHHAASCATRADIHRVPGGAFACAQVRGHARYRRLWNFLFIPAALRVHSNQK